MLRYIGRIALFFLWITLLGQIPIQGKSLENRYHQAVNHPKFQKTFWTIARPLTWTGEKIQALYVEFAPRLRKNREAQEEATEAVQAR